MGPTFITGYDSWVGDQPFRQLFELSPDAIILYDRGVVVEANQSAVELLRAPSLAALLGRHSRELVHPDFHKTVEGHANATMAGTRRTRSEEQYVRLDGTLVDVEVTAAKAEWRESRAFIVILRDLTERREAEARRQRELESALRSDQALARERSLREILDVLPIGIFARDGEGKFVYVNRHAAELMDSSVQEILGQPFKSGFQSEEVDFAAEDRAVLEGGELCEFSGRVAVDTKGRRRTFDGKKLRVRWGETSVVLGVFTDLTERKELEAQLLHAQKMEGLGRVAGGIAHDFNNLLTVIIECTDYLIESVADPGGDLASIREAATRGAWLTRQMLTFARQVPMTSAVVSVDDVVAETAKLLVRVLGEDIALVTELGTSCERANLDPCQLELIIMNLAVNARDAMPDGGRLVLATRPVDYSARAGEPEGRWLELSVRDDGSGMDEATRMRALDPFFTTKPAGRGTGLGLSTCYGIVTELGGRIFIESELGRGTTVRLLFPACSEAVTAAARQQRTSVPPSLGETVLMLEDDPSVRRTTGRMLRKLGYTVLSAALPNEALRIAREHEGPIDVLLTDVVMPEINGVVAAKAFSELRPEAVVLFVSGYSRDAFPRGAAVSHYLAKPFTRDELAVKLREVIERGVADALSPPSA